MYALSDYCLYTILLRRSFRFSRRLVLLHHVTYLYVPMQHEKNQDDIRLTMLGAIQGSHMPMRIKMERALVGKV